MKCARLAIRIGTVAAILAALFSIGSAQNRERFGISAKAGGVNSVSGSVMVKREGQAPQLLTSRDELAAGDVVTTGASGQVEILLNPGSYFRAGENTEFILVNGSLDDLLLKLVRGSAIIEATGPNDAGLRINIATDQKRLVIVRAGIYRINAQTGMTELIVRKGRVMLGTGKDEMVKGGKRMTFGGAEVPQRSLRSARVIRISSIIGAKNAARLSPTLTRDFLSVRLIEIFSTIGGIWLSRPQAPGVFGPGARIHAAILLCRSTMVGLRLMVTTTATSTTSFRFSPAAVAAVAASDRETQLSGIRD